jgi:hypothetical protein
MSWWESGNVITNHATKPATRNSKRAAFLARSRTTVASSQQMPVTASRNSGASSCEFRMLQKYHSRLSSDSVGGMLPGGVPPPELASSNISPISEK